MGLGVVCVAMMDDGWRKRREKRKNEEKIHSANILASFVSETLGSSSELKSIKSQYYITTEKSLLSSVKQPVIRKEESVNEGDTMVYL